MIIDDFLPNPHLEREHALTRKYETIEHNAIKYRGISYTENPKSIARIQQVLGEEFTDVRVMYRRYLEDEENETYIHSDVLIGKWTGILFLNVPAQCRGGVAFWAHKKTGLSFAGGGHGDEAFWATMYLDGFHEEKWQMTELIPMKFNRLVLFPSARFHSRWPMKSFGKDLASARLIKVFFLK